MFQFTLVHVPGIHHGPDGLSCQRAQEGDEPEPEDDFDDWINQVYGFMHLINAPPTLPAIQPLLTPTPPIACYIIDSTREDPEEPEETQDPVEHTPNSTPTSYDDVPRSVGSVAIDDKLETVKYWLRHLALPPDQPEPPSTEYKSFI